MLQHKGLQVFTALPVIVVLFDFYSELTALLASLYRSVITKFRTAAMFPTVDLQSAFHMQCVYTVEARYNDSA